ncbi:M20 metallopeptidase family protein [Veillonella denticariosi]|uniref:M20 metallopeptidase family protein n=1 Tax=Veillonella denticariosi TaxID=419208 RepID=UPI002491D109|nr:M20 family metallopeptidase [Veillonella denticariosi]
MHTLQDLIKQYASQYKEQVVAWRRHIHSHPELSGEEKETSAFIQSVLTDLGIPFKADVYKYAVIGEIKGAFDGPVVGLRADMDALPITEVTGLPFTSENPGVMHACGHDSHMAILLGAAAILQSVKDQLHGTVKLVFQPAEEEALIKGAQGIVDSGVLDDVDEIYGLHVWPQLPVGTVGLKKGNFMAASDRFLVHIKGKATHGAEPHNGIDAIVAAANWIVNVESIVARETNPMDNLVCTIGVFNSGDRYNVGSGDAYLEGTCRTYDPAKRDYIERRLGKSLKALDMMFGTTSTLEYRRGHGATINDADAIDYVTHIVETYLGKDAVVHPEFPSMAAEDFSAYLNKIKGAFLWLGTGFEGNPALHNAAFTIDESILEPGITMMAGIAAELLQEK